MRERQQDQQTSSNILRQQAAGMDFNGTWKVYHEENVTDFLRTIGKNCLIFISFMCTCMLRSFFTCLQGAPEMMVKMRGENKPVIVIEQNGKDFIYTVKTPIVTKVHSFTIGKDTEMTAVDGRKFKCTVREEEGKLITQTEKFTSVREIIGDEMVETMTAGSVTFISKSKRI
ncbi:fatty acid-binding protein, liver-like [Cheilinus undulatus]|uniref:fatty acid-binding protein, liver-like n=1 Tax=Cheilinus undulatus TaxID=241271 RepID=UPI001BD1E9A2|nr:fatty acid-binding protein, liver-like [Cheilinus undulatus]